MGVVSTKCADFCRQQHLENGEIKLLQMPSRQFVPPQQISPVAEVCRRYRQIKGDCSWLTTRDSYILESNRGVFYGDIYDGHPTGFGRLLNPDGSFFEGEFFNGVVHTSRGLYIYPDASYYFGEVRNSKAEGKGCFVYRTNGDLKYEGEWLNDMPHGKGIETLSDGSQYRGQFQCGMKSGKNGMFKWPNGDKYQGDFVEGMMEGQGIFEAADGYKYTGSWHKNKRHGQGLQEFPDGNKVNGQFQDDNRVGNLKVTTDGRVIDGRESFNKFIPLQN